MRLRRGGAVAMVLLLLFALLVLAAAALTVVAATGAGVEREYRSSQALALAEAGLAAASAQGPGGGEQQGTRQFAEGENRWSRSRSRAGGWAVESRGIVVIPNGTTLTRTLRADLVRRKGQWVLTHWREVRVR